MVNLNQPKSNVLPIPNLSQLSIRDRLKKSYPQFVGEDGGASWKRLLEKSEIMELPADMLVMQPESPCKQLMLILEGSVRVYQSSPDDREITLYRSHSGDLCVLSINGMLKRSHFGAYAKTETKVIALTLSYDDFKKAMVELPVFCEFVLINLTDRINDVMEMTEATVFESLDTRLMCLIGRVSRENNSDTIYYTHQELARELGTSREVVSRILKVFERQGCIELNRGSIKIKI